MHRRSVMARWRERRMTRLEAAVAAVCAIAAAIAHMLGGLG